MKLTDQDVADLRVALQSEPPAFYKGGYYLAHHSRGVAAFLRRNGFRVEVNDDTGTITVEPKRRKS